MADNKQIKDGLGNLFTVRMRDYSTDGSLQKTMMDATLVPVEYGPGGVYGHCAKSGTMANAPALTAAPIYSFFWPGAVPSTLFALVRRVRVSAWATGVFTAGIGAFDIFAARAWTGQDSGGTAANLAAYNASKGAVRLLSKSVALSGARKRPPVRCNSVHPAFIEGDMVDGLLRTRPDRERARAKLTAQIPLARLGLPREVANTVVWLLSDASSFTTGSEVLVDGGLTAG